MDYYQKILTLFETYPNLVKIPGAERTLKIENYIKNLTISADERYIVFQTSEFEIAMIEITSLEALFDPSKIPSLDESIVSNLLDLKSVVDREIYHMKFISFSETS